MAQELHDEFGPQGYAFNTNEIAFCILRCVAFFNSDVALIMPIYGKDMFLDNSKSVKILGLNYRPTK